MLSFDNNVFDGKISIRQFQILLILNIFGTGVIALPRNVASYADQDGWIVVVISSLMALMCVFIITSLCRMVSNYTFTHYACKILTRPVGIIISVLFAVKLILDISLKLRLCGEIIKQTMLSFTPLSVICVVVLLVSAYTASKGYEARGRIAELLIIIVFLPFMVVFFLAAKDADYSNLLPVFITPPKSLFTGGFMNLISFSGIELCMLAAFYINKPQKMRKSAITAVSLIGLLMVSLTIVAIARFGYFGATKQMWPILEMMDSVNFPGGFIEGQNAIVLSFWIVSVFAVVNAGLFFSSHLLKDVAGKGKQGAYILGICPVVFLLALLPENIMQVLEATQTMFFTFGIGFMIVLPVVLLIIAKIRIKIGRLEG